MSDVLYYIIFVCLFLVSGLIGSVYAKNFGIAGKILISIAFTALGGLSLIWVKVWGGSQLVVTLFTLALIVFGDISFAISRPKEEV